MSLTGLGVDVVEIKRFISLKKNRQQYFLKGNYTQKELDYCFSFKDPYPHLAGIFAAKEAVFKTIGQKNFLQSSIEIRREINGKPAVWIKSRHRKSVLVSISHTDKIAIAVAIRQ